MEDLIQGTSTGGGVHGAAISPVNALHSLSARILELGCSFSSLFFILMMRDHIDTDVQTSILIHRGVQLLL
ncbi:hypothetical protein OIU76_005706 [Salix suchowensis]|nr:hypothetical protein OIU76_005706 [Salix suchowensis]